MTHSNYCCCTDGNAPPAVAAIWEHFSAASGALHIIPATKAAVTPTEDGRGVAMVSRGRAACWGGSAPNI